MVLLHTAALAQRMPVVVDPGMADVDPHQAEVQAATSNGTASLRDQVLRMQLTRDVQVADFIQNTDSIAQLNKLLQTAQPVGGPRWVDDHTCQVRMEIPASQISAFLLDIAHRDPSRSPIQPRLLHDRLGEWTRLKFCGLGSSVNGDAIELARPHDATGNWSEISDTDRRAAVSQARADAVRYVIQSLEQIPLSSGFLLKNALTRPAVADRLNTRLLRQPVTRIEFLDNLKVSITVSLSPHCLGNAVQSAIDHDPEFARGLSIDWPHVHEKVDGLSLSISGYGSVAAPVATTLPANMLVSETPDWVDQQLQAEATASGAGPRLKIGRLAEGQALDKIHDQILLLHLNPTRTLADACRTDIAIHEAVDRALLHTHTYNAEYRADGSVKVRVTLDLRDAWEELRSNP